MSYSSPTQRKHNTRSASLNLQEDKNKSNDRLRARSFTSWYKNMVDHDRQNLTLYMSDDVILEWFGRTIKTRKKVCSFLKHDMQCSRHDFLTVQSVDKIQNRQERSPSFRKEKDAGCMHNSPELSINKTERKRRLLRSNCSSPEWAEGCQPLDEVKDTANKRLKGNNVTAENECKNGDVTQRNGVKRGYESEESIDVNSTGDGVIRRRVKRKLVPVTPPNRELGQGDCLPSTSADSDKSHDALNAQLPKLFVECNGYIEFSRTKNNRDVDSMKWERKCKIQISYSEDPLNVGEYIIWAVHYTDETKCRRNLLPAFEEVAKEEELKNKG
ncbi:uncharacterized protein LOC114359551 [Ostrinia furnacalis]|uniref:uncharacterized protein LOC114359551 n=1 Tax=Ostrinia furnacalis TaxID=93504 RepID=UPI00103D4D5C|nr:uncharacterized protein LOC114359551 [Ostrinia furnacalis]XP_028169793.1 uncharacterized protein LOC114359551 [Ostrinia furnacalis]